MPSILEQLAATIRPVPSHDTGDVSLSDPVVITPQTLAQRELELAVAAERLRRIQVARKNAELKARMPGLYEPKRTTAEDREREREQKPSLLSLPIRLLAAHGAGMGRALGATSPADGPLSASEVAKRQLRGYVSGFKENVGRELANIERPSDAPAARMEEVGGELPEAARLVMDVGLDSTLPASNPVTDVLDLARLGVRGARAGAAAVKAGLKAVPELGRNVPPLGRLAQETGAGATNILGPMTGSLAGAAAGATAGDSTSEHVAGGVLGAAAGGIAGAALPRLLARARGVATTAPEIAQAADTAAAPVHAVAPGEQLTETLSRQGVPSGTVIPAEGSARWQRDVERFERILDRSYEMSDEAKAQARDLFTQGQHFYWERRGVVSNDRTLREAEKVWFRSVEFPRGTTLNAAEQTALRQQVAGYMGRLTDLTSAVAEAQKLEAAGDAAGAAAIYQRFDVNTLPQLQAAMRSVGGQALAVLRSSEQVASESGRALQARKIRVEGQVGQTELTRRALKAGATDEQVMALLQLQDPAAQYQYLRSLSKPGAQDYWRWYLYSNMLSGVATHARNVWGNTVGLVGQTAGRYVGELLDRGQTLERGETLAGVRALPQAARKGLRQAREVMRQGYTREDSIALTERSPEIGFGSEVATRVLNVVPRAMEAGDRFFRALAEGIEISAHAYRKAAREARTAKAAGQSFDFDRRVAELVANPDPETLKVAEAIGHRAAYRSEMGGFAKGVRQTASLVDKGMARIGQRVEKATGSKALGFVASAPVGTMVVPFVGTPANIFKRAFAVGSGADLLLGQRLVRQGKVVEGRMRQGEAAIALAVNAALVSLAANGVIEITGADPRERILGETGEDNLPAERDKMWAERPPQSVRVGDKWINYNLLGPAGVPLAAIGNVSDSLRRGGSGGELAADVVTTMPRSLLGQTFLQGAMNLGQAMGEMTRGSVGGDQNALVRFAGATAQSLLPAASFQRGVRNVIDPKGRRPRTESLPQGIADNLLNVLPGLSRRVPALVDYAGEYAAKPGGLGQRLLQQTVLPTEIRPAKADPVRDEMVRLGIYLSKPQGKWKGFKPDDKTQVRVARDMGRQQYRALKTLFASPEYQQLSDEQKARAARNVMAANRKAVRALAVAKFGTEKP